MSVVECDLRRAAGGRRNGRVYVRIIRSGLLDLTHSLDTILTFGPHTTDTRSLGSRVPQKAILTHIVPFSERWCLLGARRFVLLDAVPLAFRYQLLSHLRFHAGSGGSDPVILARGMCRSERRPSNHLSLLDRCLRVILNLGGINANFTPYRVLLLIWSGLILCSALDVASARC